MNMLRLLTMRGIDIRGKRCDLIDPIELGDRAGWLCESCGQSTPREKRGSTEDDAPEVDHIIPLSKGGTHTLDNVQILCRRCNRTKSDSLALDIYVLNYLKYKHSFEVVAVSVSSGELAKVVLGGHMEVVLNQ